MKTLEPKITSNSNELKKLIAENPDLDICVLYCTENSSDCYWTYASNLTFGINDVLTCDPEEYCDFCDFIPNDKDDFYTLLEDEFGFRYLEECQETGKIYKEDECQKYIDDTKAQFEPYWKKCICIYAVE